MNNNDNNNLYSNNIRPPENGEIELFAVWEGLMKKKWNVVAITAIIILIAAIYAFSIKPVYQSSAYFMPVEKEWVQKLNNWDVLLGREESYTPESVFLLFQNSVVSRLELWKFFNRHELYQVYGVDSEQSRSAALIDRQSMQKAFDKFYRNFSINIPKKQDNGQSFSISFELPLSEKKVQSLLADYLHQIRTQVRQSIADSIRVEKISRIEQMKTKIDSMRAVAKDLRSDRLAELDEAIAIARELKLESPPSLGAKATIQGVTNQGLPLYYLGYRLLAAEKKVLISRESDDPFIKGLRPLQEKMNLLDSFELKDSNFAVVKVDQKATIGQKVKPKKALILLTAGMFGLIVAVFITLIGNSMANRKNAITK